MASTTSFERPGCSPWAWAWPGRTNIKVAVTAVNGALQPSSRDSIDKKTHAGWMCVQGCGSSTPAAAPTAQTAAAPSPTPAVLPVHSQENTSSSDATATKDSAPKTARLSPQQVLQVEQCFHRLDFNRDGSLTKKELNQVARAIGDKGNKTNSSLSKIIDNFVPPSIGVIWQA